jgi:hypothetical protein
VLWQKLECGDCAQTPQTLKASSVNFGSDARLAPLPALRRHNQTLISARISDCFHCYAHLFFPLFPIVLAPAAFLLQAQGLAL